MIDWTSANFLPWLIPVPPIIAFGLIVLLFNRNWWLTVVTALSASVVSWALAFAVFMRSTGMAFGSGLEGAAFGSSYPWMDLGTSQLMMGVMVDPLTAVMLFMVPLAILMIFIYSVGYMFHDPRRERFFAYMALFAGAMLTLVVADNLLLLFLGWEVMGFCSYSLIGFWYEKDSAYKAGVKAFMTTRVADVIMLLGIAYLFAEAGTLSFRTILFDTAFLTELAATPALLFGGAISAAGLIGVFLVTGTVGKSAQFPLHVWLPDAMEGPTPVSAMIHAAAMVSAGVYMVIRMYPLLSAGADPHHGVYSAPLLMMAYIGAGTALFSAIIAVAQNDIKRVLAYSTISQLGFMIAALGIGAYIAAAFHLITHAFFKALLFMSSGSVIHAMEHGEHHVHDHGGHPHNAFEGDGDFDPQDMRNMGGLRNNIPVTWWAFLAGGMSLAGLPLITAGFWSKDEIFAEGWYLGFVEGFPPAIFVFVLLVVAAFLTAFYTTRQIAMTFGGEHRTESAKEAGLGGPTSIVSIFMQLPLIILAVLAIFAGFRGVPQDFPLLGSILSSGGNPFHDFVAGTLSEHPAVLTFRWMPVLFSLLVSLGGIFLGWRVYWRKPMTTGQEDPAKVALDKISPYLWQWMENKFYVDELYQAVLVGPANWISETLVSAIMDKGIIDGFLHTVAAVAAWIGELFKRFNRVVIDGLFDGIPEAIGMFGSWLRGMQTGNVQLYMWMSLFAALLVILTVAAMAGEVSMNALIAIVGALLILIVVSIFYDRIRGGEAE